MCRGSKSIQLRHQPQEPVLLKVRIGMHVKKLVFAGRLESGGELCTMLVTQLVYRTSSHLQHRLNILHVKRQEQIVSLQLATAQSCLI